jgi:hypothetical protein
MKECIGCKYLRWDIRNARPVCMAQDAKPLEYAWVFENWEPVPNDTCPGYVYGKVVGEIRYAQEADKLQELEAGIKELESTWKQISEPDPDISGLSTWEISSLLHLLWVDEERLTDAYLCSQFAAELKSKGLIRLTRCGHYALTDTGRTLANHIIANMRRKAPEPPADVWSQPVIDMAWQQCAGLCAAMGRRLETIQHETYKYEWRLHGKEDHRAHGSSVNGEVAAHLAVRYCAKCEDRYDSVTDRVRLTGLEVK